MTRTTGSISHVSLSYDLTQQFLCKRNYSDVAFQMMKYLFFKIELICGKVVYLGTGCNGIERFSSATETDRFVWAGLRQHRNLIHKGINT